jgi:hypothetical protein
MASGVFKAVAAILVVVFALSKCNSETRQARSEFVAGCTQSGLSDGVCKCAVKKVFEHYGDKAIVAMQRSQAVPPDMPSVTVRATAQCAKE